MSTGIEWTDETWNPITGCSAVSPGCDHCYAERQSATRLAHVPAYAGLTAGGKWTGELRYHPDRLHQPLRWTRPRRVFVNSMSDLFHPDVPIQQLAAIFAVMAAADRHDFQILTKRPQHASRLLNDDHGGFRERIAAMHDALELTRWPDNGGHRWPLPNVWIGTSIENHSYRFRARYLQETPAAVRFISAEPLLGPIQFRGSELRDIDWMIVGGESGREARPMQPDWARHLRDQAIRENVAFLFKQWGEWAPGSTPHAMKKVGKKAAGRELDGRTWDEYPRAPRQRLVNNPDL